MYAMVSEERLLREAIALRELARHARYVLEMSSDDHQKKVLRRHADEFDKRASLLESEASTRTHRIIAPPISGL
jgi:hypothetical protein